MARIARVVAPEYPHHITQRGNRRQETFFCDDDYRLYIQLMSEWCSICGVAIWAYCLMPNHVHFIAVPQTEDSLKRGIGEAHRRYTRHVNFRENWRGHLWQGRFASYLMDEKYLLAATRYVELNPVRAKIVADAAEYPWSSAGAHIRGIDDGFVSVAPLLTLVDDWRSFLAGGLSEDEHETMRKHERTGRPLGNNVFIEEMEGKLGKTFTPKKGGRPKKEKN
jgi:putative transposase